MSAYVERDDTFVDAPWFAACDECDWLGPWRTELDEATEDMTDHDGAEHSA